jgi:tetratricopeptide (TPR) repeat protein
VQANVWKVADFGCTVEGTAVRPRPTVFSRGTNGYRAPELLRTIPHFTNKTDIWALGCILYELVMAKRAFENDWEIGMYPSRGAIVVNQSGYPEQFQNEASKFIASMLHVNPRNRPAAAQLVSTFSDSCQTILTHAGPEDAEVKELFEPKENDSEGLAIWKEFVRKFPKVVSFQDQLANAFRTQGEQKSSHLILQYIAKHDPLESLFGKIQTQAFETPFHTSTAICQWHEIFSTCRSPWFVPDRLSRAFAERKQGHAEPNYWNQMMECDPLYADRWRTSLINAYKRINLAGGLAKWKSLIDKTPYDIRLYSEIDLIFTWMNARDERITFWQEMMEKHTYVAPSIAGHLAAAYKERPAEEEIEFWKGKVERNPEDATLLDSLSKVLRERAGSEQEIKVWRDLALRFPRSTFLAGSLTEAHGRGADERKALSCWIDLLNSAPDTVEWQNQVTEIFEKMDDRRTEIETWKELVSRNSGIVTLQYKLSQAVGF